jgi:ABC-2 type transport system permease protein
LIGAAIIVAGGTWLADSAFLRGIGPGLGTAFLVFSAYALVLGPQLARQDFRSDISNTDILKTYPLRGWQIMLGELLTPAAVLTGIIWLMLLAGVMLFPQSPEPRMAWFTTALHSGAVIGVALLVPLLCMTQLLIANAAAVLFPAWSLNAANRGPQGIEVMGQRILFMVVQMLALVLMLAPVVIVAGLAFLITRWIAGDMIAAGVAIVLAMAVLASEIAAGVWLLGERFEKLDLSQELRP